MARRTISLDSPGGEWLADITRWRAEGNGDNDEQIERLKRNLAKAREVVLTPRQKEVVALYYDKELTQGQISLQLGLTRSTVSRTLQRARKRLYDALRFSL